MLLIWQYKIFKSIKNRQDRAKYLKSIIEYLQIGCFYFVCNRPELEDLSSEDEAVATDLDMHALILSSSTDTHSPEEPLKTAEEVLREIDDIMQASK